MLGSARCFFRCLRNLEHELRYPEHGSWGAKDMQRSAPRLGRGNDLHSQLTRLEQSGSGYELHLILSLSANLAASVLGRDLVAYRLRRGPGVHVLSPP
jgi:hypothetical protein